MKILKKHLKQGVVKVKVETLDDLWYLSHVVEPGDVVRSKTERKIKLGGEDDRKTRVTRKWVTLTLRAEKIDFHKTTNVLRINGVIIQGPEDISQGSHHTFNVDEGTTISIKKSSWPSYLLDKLEEATHKVGENVLICVHDREEASFGLLTKRGLDVLSSIKGDVEKKRAEDQQVTGNFYKDIARAVKAYDDRYEPQSIVIASPGFWKEYSMKELDEGLKEKATQANCSVTGERGLKEVVNRPELKAVLQKDRTRKESKLLDEVMEAISKDKACYGLEDCWEKTKIGAVEKLAVSDNFILKMRDEEKYEQLDKLMKSVEHMDGEVSMVSSDEEARKLDELGGVAGVLRWEAKQS